MNELNFNVLQMFHYDEPSFIAMEDPSIIILRTTFPIGSPLLGLSTSRNLVSSLCVSKLLLMKLSQIIAEGMFLYYFVCLCMFVCLCSEFGEKGKSKEF